MAADQRLVAACWQLDEDPNAGIIEYNGLPKIKRETAV